MALDVISTRRALARIGIVIALIATTITIALSQAPDARSADAVDRLVTVSSSGLFSYVVETKTASSTATVSFGANSDQPLVGDWDCNGVATPGVYRTNQGRLFLSNHVQSGHTDTTFYFGSPGDVALAGDFNGDGCDTVAVYRPSTATFHIRFSLSEGRANIVLPFGNPGDLPFVGDFDGDGRDTVGVYRRGRVYLSNDLRHTIASTSFLYGNPGDQPFTGDWNGNGRDGVGLYRPATGWVYLQDSGTSLFAGTGRKVLVAAVDPALLKKTDKLPPVSTAPKPKSPAPTTPPPSNTTPTTTSPAPANTPQPPPSNFTIDVELYPGDDLRAAANNAPSGTVFRINGEHHGQEIAPKDGQVFVGAPGARMLGDGRADAFRSSASNVVVQGLEITGYAPGSQEGTIQAMGDNWVIRSNSIHHNDGVGIKVYKADRASLLDNVIDHNEQLGVSVAYSDDTVVEGNEISYNNFNVKYNWGWEAGGTKFWSTGRLIVRDNWSHHNHGPGLWTDHDNFQTLYEGNTVEDNYAAGIFHEISYSAVIRNNVARRNGFGHDAWLWGGGITIAASQDVEVYGNQVAGNYNGITMVQQDRGSGSQGAYIVRNNHVHDNTITDSGKTGAARDVSSQAIFSDNNRFTSNDYVGDVQWEWVNSRHSWDEWRSFGHDVDGSYR